MDRDPWLGGGLFLLVRAHYEVVEGLPDRAKSIVPLYACLDLLCQVAIGRGRELVASPHIFCCGLLAGPNYE